jgi:hypothetical protein
MKNREYAVEAVVQEFYGQSMTEDEGFIAPDFFGMAREILNLRAERDEALKLVDEHWVTHQQIIAARSVDDVMVERAWQSIADACGAIQCDEYGGLLPSPYIDNVERSDIRDALYAALEVQP